MSFIFSGESPNEPVISAKTGRLYEKRLLQKYLSENRQHEPQADHALTPDDIIPVHSDSPPVKPRPPTLTSIPSLLSTFQNEWDALVLETFSLKQQYHQVRQELSQALYQNDAACRVVARLMKERDDARQALATLQAQVAAAEPVATQPPDTMEVDATAVDAAQVYYETAAETAKTLSTTRGKREVPADFTSPEAWKTAGESSAISSLHSTTKPGITTLDVDQSGSLLLTGGMDNHAEVYSRATDTVVATLKGHTKRLTAALWLGGGGVSASIVTASADKSVRLWAAKPGNSEDASRAVGWTKKNIVKHHGSEVVGLSVHPSGKYFASAAADGSWAVHSAGTGDVVVSGTVDSSVSGIAYHPDGMFLGLGTMDGYARILDAGQQQVLATLDVASEAEEAEKVVGGLHFSENGYYLVTVTRAEVAVWDLRKQKKTVAWGLKDIDGEGSFVDAKFDASGKYLAVVKGSSIHLLRAKGWAPMVALSCADTVACVRWIGHLSNAVAAACAENSVHIYEPSK
ncbi:hypothetical protein IW152_005646 [Coemansia sp. BCRC 34962]|nr:hypothetical protein IW152_005646 [Coemansia sp. BCRC 34962]